MKRGEKAFVFPEPSLFQLTSSGFSREVVSIIINRGFEFMDVANTLQLLLSNRGGGSTSAYSGYAARVRIVVENQDIAGPRETFVNPVGVVLMAE